MKEAGPLDGYPMPYPTQAVQTTASECAYKRLVHTLNRSNEPGGLLTEFSVLSVDCLGQYFLDIVWL